MTGTPFTLNELPRFSPWPARLLGIEPWKQREKNAKELTREWEHDIYSQFLQKVRTAGRPFSAEEVDHLWVPDTGSWPCADHGEFRAVPPREFRLAYLDFVRSALGKRLPASALVELGCGYGSVLLRLAHRPEFRGLPVLGAEYTASGVELAKLVAERERVPLTVARCDIAADQITDLPIPESALIFTSFTTHYIPRLTGSFVRWLSDRRPRVVVHVEPFYEHCAGDTLLGLMRRRYIEVNDYNRNLMTLLRQHEREGLITILEERPAVFGGNALFAASVVAWSPKG